MNETAISDEERTLAAFVDVVFEDPDFVEMEFEAIIADWCDPRRETTTFQWPGHRDSRWADIRFRMSPSVGGPPALETRSTIRSPPVLRITEVNR